MKRITTLILFLFITIQSFAQTEGISYQAVIIAPDVLELPGVDSEGNYLPSAEVDIQFSIIAPGSGAVEFTEIQSTTTDEFGRINLIIGAGNYDKFEKIDWNGDPKSLKVEIDFKNGDGFVFMNIEKLTYVPYVAHRNITATGTLDVDDDTFLNRELTVGGPTQLNSTLLVDGGNAANLTGDLTVDGETNLGRSLTVGNGASGIDIDAPTLLNGTLDVIGKTTVQDFEAKGQATFDALEANSLQVNSTTNLIGQFNVDSNQQIVLKSTVHTAAIAYANNADGVPQAQNDPGLIRGNYPVLVEGSTQGIAIKINGNRRNGNNFVSFWDDNNMWGRIEGEIPSEFENNADYRFDQRSLNYDIFDGASDYAFALIDAAIAGATLGAALADVRPCAGLGACVVSPGPGPIAAAIGNSILALGKGVSASIAVANSINNKVVYNNNKDTYQGVTYASGAGDYAEYLERENPSDEMTYGDIVGVKGGKISKRTMHAEKAMVVSLKPIVLGNMPEKNISYYEKVAFMGQVPVKVFGKVDIGDYIIPSGKNDGIGIALKPSNVTSSNVKKIVGIAWEANPNVSGFNTINVAVGLNNNDHNPIIKKLEQKVDVQEAQISELKGQISQILLKLSNIESGSMVSKQQVAKAEIKNHEERPYEIVDTKHGEAIYFKLERADFEAGFEFAEKQLADSGIDLEENAFWKKIKNDPNFKNTIIEKLQKKFSQQMHYHKEVSAKKH